MRKRAEYLGRADNGLSAKGVLALVTKVAPGMATLATNLLVGRLGGAALLGLTQTTISTAALASLVYPTPAASAASRFVSASVGAGSPDKAAGVAAYLARRVAFGVACLILIISGASAVLGIKDTTIVAVSCIMTVGVSSRIFIEGLHFGGGEGRRLARWAVAVAFIGVLGSTVLLASGVRNAWVITPVAFANITFAIMTWPGKSKYKLDQRLRRTIRQFLFLAALGTFASSGFVQATTLVANLAAGVSFAGEYAAALTLTTPLAIVATAISATLFPALSSMHSGVGPEAVRRHVAESTSIVITLLGGAVCGIAVLAVPLVAFVWGDLYSNTWWILLFLLVGTLVTAVSVPSVTVLTSSSNRGMLISACSSLGGALVSVLLWVLLVPVSAEIGVIVGCTVAIVVSAFVPYVLAWRRYRMAWFMPMLALGAAVMLSCLVSVLAHEGYIPVALLPVLAISIVAAWALLRRGDVAKIVKLVLTIRRKKT